MISVIILTYNGEKYIRKCLDSVVNQTIGMEQIEITIVDDVSTDATVEILKEYEARYPENICLILREKNSMVTGEVNRNIGVNRANGKYILFLDQDDWFEQDSFEILMGVANANPDIDYIEYSFSYTDSVGNIYKVSKPQKSGLNIYDIADEQARNELAKTGVLPGATYVWNKMYRKEFLICNNICHNEGELRTGFSDNFFSGLLVMYASKIAKLDSPLYNYRNYIGSYSHDAKKNSKVQFERCKVGIVFYEECARRGLTEKNREMVEYVFLRTFLLKTFWKFLLQFEPVPYDILSYIQKEVLTRCPQYLENSIMKDKEEMQLVALVLAENWTNEFLENLRLQIEEKEEKRELKKYMYLI